MAIKAVLAFSYRDTDGSRVAPFIKTKEMMVPLYAWHDVLTVDSGHEVFSRAGTRNKAVKLAEAAGADVVVLCDADSFCTGVPLLAAIDSAYTTHVPNYPFDIALELIPKALDMVGSHSLAHVAQKAYSKYTTEGGCWVITPAAYWATGGMDERIKYWGPEDRCFIAASRTLLGDPIKHPGQLFCFWHNRDEIVWQPDDVALLIRYNTAFGDKVAMQALVDEEGRIG